MKQRKINLTMLVFISLLVALPVGIGTHGLIFFIQQSRRLLRLSPIPIWYIWAFFTAPIVIGFVILMHQFLHKRKFVKGHELYIYTPGSFLKPILILSKKQNDVAIKFCTSLNSFTTLADGFDKTELSDWIIVQPKGNSLFEEWKERLQKEDGFYFELYGKYKRRIRKKNKIEAKK